MCDIGLSKSCKLLANVEWTDIRTNGNDVVHSFGHVNSKRWKSSLDWHCLFVGWYDDGHDDDVDDGADAGDHDVDIDSVDNDNINVSIANVLIFLFLLFCSRLEQHKKLILCQFLCTLVVSWMKFNELAEHTIHTNTHTRICIPFTNKQKEHTCVPEKDSH